ncbi:arabinosylfuranosidase ArfA [Amphiplicatus metriothermophilus]|uniref:non-reducing end alpha-L-arabinofuranosidase n=1 Tax=Amphiplicatus metriothermophilus TaxID=1519374 RepID=A0A239PZQ0_9PROT|nr:alpha-N-arabinofuranosidase [Amphiplicatus metriothermophilus]MBB5519814.1 alpha-N-arabinofuranosidase [Amphiplicatus metriothermophilus]SNT75147.1 alpha-N-arabinofuranosidase [Amphiplicatus metriothermophilus]
MLKSRLIVDRDFVLAPLDRRIFGVFVEHMGRCVYSGVYEPDHREADEKGFRRDVLALTRELGPTIGRYPGGNFLSGYNWEDGVGPKDRRPVRRDLAWGATETNQFGTNEFIDWCRVAGLEPMFAVNLGTRGPDEARNFLEYCNHPRGTYWSELRRSHGYEEPHDVKFWCLGNEMDGPWQICAKTAREYGRIAQETAKVMRLGCDSLQLAVCGSSYRDMPTYRAWEYEVLDLCFEHVDFISLHQYFRNDENDIEKFLTAIDDLDCFITEVAAIADAIAAKRRSPKRIMLSLDEWNVWYKAHGGKHLRKPGWPLAPRLLEEVYNVEDALVVGGALITLMNNADRVKVACLAQLVNVIGPIMTEPGGPAWRQTIFHPFALSSRFARGEVMRAKIETGRFAAGKYDAAPLLVSSVLHDPESGRVAVFALNRSLDAEMALKAELRGFGPRRLEEAFELHHDDLKAANTREAPNTVAPKPHQSATIDGEILSARLKPLSWNVFVTRLTP